MKELPIGFRRRKNGSLEYRFLIGSKRVSVSGMTVTECRRKEREKREEAVRKGLTGSDKITLSEYFDLWISQRERSIKESSVVAHKQRFVRISERIGGVRVTALDRRQIINLQADLAKEYTSNTVNQTITLLRSVLRSAVMDDIIVKNPAEGVRALKRTEQLAVETVHRALTVEEQILFFEYAEKSWYYELFAFMIQTGVRIGEALALKWSDVDYRLEVVKIRRTVTRTEAGHVIGDSPKSRSGIRDIPITMAVKEILGRQREKLRWLIGENAVKDDSVIFVNSKGMPAVSNGINIIIYQIAKRARIDRISSHCFRDTFATRAIEQGMNPLTLKTLLGHSSLAMTMNVYAHVLPNTRKEEMDRLNITLPQAKQGSSAVVQIPTKISTKSPQETQNQKSLNKAE